MASSILRKVAISLAFGLTAGLSLPAAAATITLQPDPAAGKDAVLDELNPDSNYGGNPNLISNPADDYRSIGLIEFDLGAIPAGAAINSATLELYHSASTNLNQRYDAFRVTSAWNEGTVTFNTQPSFNATAVSSLLITDTSFGLFRSWDVTSVIQGWVDASFNNYGLWIEDGPVPGLGSAYFKSSDDVAAFRPKLTIDYVPEPTTALLLATGLAGLAAAGRRRSLH